MTSPPQHDEFYVGYLPTPPRHRRALRVAVPALLWLAAIIAGAASLAQRSPGDAVWSDATPVTISGTLFESPYPFLLPDDGPPIFLVEIGKRSARARIAPLEGRHAAITGWTLDRDGRRIVELIPEAGAITPAPHAPAAAAPSPSPREPVTIRGEIVDLKCYLGAMKPGDGKTHKACATLCITNGIPPMIVSRDPAGRPVYTLLLGPCGETPPPAMLARIAEPVIVTGRDADLAGQPVILADSVRAAAD